MVTGVFYFPGGDSVEADSSRRCSFGSFLFAFVFWYNTKKRQPIFMFGW
jgi:hypothetical protein